MSYFGYPNDMSRGPNIPLSSNVVYIGGQPFLAQQWAQPTVVINTGFHSNPHWIPDTRTTTSSYSTTSSSSSSSGSKFCSGCGNRHSASDNFCSGCGKRI